MLLAKSLTVWQNLLIKRENARVFCKFCKNGNGLYCILQLFKHKNLVSFAYS